MNPGGVGAWTLDKLRSAFATQHKLERVLLYGSRARDDHTAGSGIDLALVAPEMTFGEFLSARAAIDGLPLIYTIDTVHFDRLEPGALKSAIERDGVVVYDRQSGARAAPPELQPSREVSTLDPGPESPLKRP